MISVGLGGENCLIGFACNGKGPAVDLYDNGAEAFQRLESIIKDCYGFRICSLVFIEPIDAWYSNS